LLALGASVTLRSAAGERSVPLDGYFTGYKTSVRKPDELMTAITWPVPATRSASAFYKLGRRHGDAITMVGVAVHASLKNGVCADVRIALGAVGPCVFRARSAEALLNGQAPTAERIAQAAAKAMAEASPIDDIRASGAYRKDQVQVLVKRLLTQTIESLS
jgi:CO/xanthine dehydrogenase FAD-binding subunit